jgi:hypothetical protein
VIPAQKFISTAKQLYTHQSGEHGIGLIQKEYMDTIFEEQQLELDRGLKKFLSINNIPKQREKYLTINYIRTRRTRSKGLLFAPTFVVITLQYRMMKKQSVVFKRKSFTHGYIECILELNYQF